MAASRFEASRETSLVPELVLEQSECRVATCDIRLAFPKLRHLALVAPVSNYVAIRRIQMPDNEQPIPRLI